MADPPKNPTTPGGTPNSASTALTVQIGKKQGSFSNMLRHLLSQEQKRIQRINEKNNQRNIKKKVTRTNRTGYERARKAGAFQTPQCRPDIDVYLANANETIGVFQKKVPRRSLGWICGAKIDYKEQTYSAQINDLRVYIEGADVTPYVMGTVRWTIETTGGMNTASFVLNNNHDAFIVTPQNVCANLNKCVWRIHGTGWRLANDRSGKPLTNQDRGNSRTDELAKYIIYSRKYKAVKPGTSGAEIDPETGVWLYPLNPFSSVIHKHDSVRIFVRLPHVSSVKKPDRKVYYDLWIPAFTGFVSEYSWDDKPVTAERTMSISCYDIRGLYDRMRVRVNVKPTAQKPPDARAAAQIREKFRTDRTLLQNIPLTAAERERLSNVINRLIKDVFELLLSCKVETAILRDCRTADMSVNSACIQKAIQNGKSATFTVVNPLITLINNTQALLNRLFDLTGERYFIVRTGFTKSRVTQAKLKRSTNRSTNDSAKLEEAIRFLEYEAKNLIALRQEAQDFIDGKSSVFEFDQLVEDAAKFGYPVPGAQSSNETEASRAKRWLDNMDVNLSTRMSGGLTNTSKHTRDRISGVFVQGRPLVQPFSTEGKRVQLLNTLKTAKQGLPSGQQLLAQAQANLVPINAELSRIEAAVKQCTKELEELSKRTQFRRAAAKRAETLKLLRRYIEARRAGAEAARARVPNSAATLADVLENQPTFSDKNAGIFADLIRQYGKHSHPLADMTFEQAVEWLVMENTNVIPGARLAVRSYRDPGKLDNWNKVCLFGQVGRPLTYSEMKIIGEGTITSTKEIFSPLNGFLNFLVPEKGTGGSTIMQRNLSHDPHNVTSYQYETRKSMLDQICTLLDYQYYISPFGDFCFEFPNYDVLPRDYGNIFRGAYEVEKELISSTIAEEAGDLPTAWVFTGSELDKSFADTISKDFGIKNRFATITIMAPILARRLGAKIESVNINLPGVGANLGQGGSANTALASLIIYGLFHINRQFGRIHKLQVEQPFRPYLLPNRPIHLIHRQRIGLIKSVTYAMNPPGGACTTSTDMGYVRWLNRDGTFRHISGGTRMPLDYTQFFPGSVSFKQVFSSGKFSSRDPLTDLTGPPNNDTVRSPRNSSEGPRFADGWNKTGVGEPKASALRKSFDSSGTTLNSGTTGSRGQSITKTTKPNSGVGARAHRRNAQSGQSSKETEGRGSRGLTSSADGKTPSQKPNPNRNSSGGDQSNRYNITELFYDPTPFLTQALPPKTFRINSFGFVRNQYTLVGRHWKRFERRSFSGRWFHTGVDLFSRATRGRVYAPIDLTGLDATFYFGSTKYSDKLKLIPVKRDTYNLVGAVTTKNTEYLVRSDQRRFLVGQGNLQSTVQVGGHRFNKGGKSTWTHDITIGIIRQVTTYQLFLYKEWEAWNRIGRTVNARNTGGALSGLRITGQGYLTPPNMTNFTFSGNKSTANASGGSSSTGKTFRGLKVSLRYLHLSEILPGPGGGLYGVKVKEIAADPGKQNPLGRIGSTGNAGANSPHLHFEVAVHYNSKYQADETYTAVFRELLKAQNEFLTRVVAYKLTGSLGNLTYDPYNAQLSKRWRDRLRGRVTVQVRDANGNLVTQTIDVNTAKAVDVVEALKKSRRISGTFRGKFKNLDDLPTGKTVVNPLFFFSPEQIIESPIQRYDNRTIAGNSNNRFSRVAPRRTTVQDSKQSLCKRLGGSGLDRTRRKSVLQRTDTDRKTRSANASFTTGARKRREKQMRRRRDEQSEERSIIAETFLIQPEKLEAALHARVADYLKFETGYNPNQENVWKMDKSRFSGFNTMLY